ncbi:diguanylate cyclase [Pseudomonas putida]|uniref:Diguanylate cyclase n=1 Tax=Pseudomonas putida TaxID=303 RepID=A0A1L5PMT1_PSEPU|nr:diguanylate cyclase [Pseudomonas putida]
MGAALAANTGGAGARHRVVFFAGEPAPTGIAVTFSFAQSLWERL